MLNSYLPEVGRVPLLTPDEEIELGRRTRNGNSPAQEKMIHSNVRLVVIIARDYVDFGLPLLDLISERTRLRRLRAADDGNSMYES